MNLSAQRRFFAEEIEAAAGLATPALVDAFAHVERERFLGPGPWILKGVDGDLFGAGRPTPDADPGRVYHNVAIAIDPARQLFNGQPGTIGAWIDQLGLRPGAHVLHVGAGTGYYTAVMAHCVGATGRVVAYEVDPSLADRARANVDCLANVDVRHGDATIVDDTFDAILVNAGVTHPLDAWLAALGPLGRLVVPITCAFPGGPISKGIVVRLTRGEHASAFDACTIGFVAIYAAVGVRDDALNARIAAALKRNPLPRVGSFRRDGHDEGPSCWLHTATFCLDTAGPPR